jgi:DNA-binding transcriptional regulator YiaG
MVSSVQINSGKSIPETRKNGRICRRVTVKGCLAAVQRTRSKSHFLTSTLRLSTSSLVDSGGNWQTVINRVRSSQIKIVCRAENTHSADVKRLREVLGVSQAVLAAFLGVNVNTVQSWEQGKRLPQPIACRFLAEIESDPAYWRFRIGRSVIAVEARKRAED